MKRILVIKLGALGDFVLAFSPFAAIRAHHTGAMISLLTTQPFAELAQAAPWFDRVITDARPSWWDLPGLLTLRQKLQHFDMVYDLQTSGRSSWYHWLADRPPWSGIATGATHPHANPHRNTMHTLERQRDQLEMAGLRHFPPADLAWLNQPPPQSLPKRYALLVPGAAPHRPAKRWPAEHFGALAALLDARGEAPVIVGTAEDGRLATAIRAVHPGSIDLTGRTSLRQLAAVAAGASVAIGNDTGPTHLAAATGVPCIALFSAESDPVLTRPRGDVTILSAAKLADLPVQRVAEALPPVH